MIPIVIKDDDHRPEVTFLDALADPCRTTLDASRAAVVVAHPDDETVGIGGQLERLTAITVIHVTDGAPRTGCDVVDHGFSTAEQYALARRRELEAAVGLAGLSEANLISLGIADQEASYQLVELTLKLAQLFENRSLELVLTHPYEGGHPDHDATAFAVHHACDLLHACGRQAPGLIEMASYFAGADCCVHQRFASIDAEGLTVVVLDEARRALKRSMLDAHATQAGSLWLFDVGEEHFRLAPSYDFLVLPNGGRLHYERFQWGLNGERWLALACHASAAIAALVQTAGGTLKPIRTAVGPRATQTSPGRHIPMPSPARPEALAEPRTDSVQRLQF